MKGKKSMLSILEEFAYGNISPESHYIKRGSKYDSTLKAVSANESKLLDKLNGEEKDVFEKFVDMQGELNQLTAVDSLIYGYKLGLMMTAEAFLTSGDLIAGE
jgi:hypothetical protein